MISLTCENCEKALRVRDELAGKRVKCPGCGNGIAVPAGGPAAPVKKKAVRREADDEDDAPSEKKLPPKPSPVLFFVGLGAALVGLIAMALFIYFSVMAGREATAKEERIASLKQTLTADNPNLTADQKTHMESVRKDLSQFQAERDRASSSSRTNMILAIVFGIVFVAGAVVRGYHQVLMKRWQSERKSSGKKKKKRRDEDDDEDEE